MNIFSKQITSKDVTTDFISELRTILPFDDENPDWKLESTLKLVQNQANIFIISFVENDIVGFLYGHVLDRFDDKKQFFIYEVGVSERFQRLGVASNMFEKLFEILRSQNISEAWVLTNKSNLAANKLYQKFGGKNPNEDDIMYDFEIK